MSLVEGSLRPIMARAYPMVHGLVSDDLTNPVSNNCNCVTLASKLLANGLNRTHHGILTNDCV